jgi:hypothetical protein
MNTKNGFNPMITGNKDVKNIFVSLVLATQQAHKEKKMVDVAIPRFYCMDNNIPIYEIWLLLSTVLELENISVSETSVGELRIGFVNCKGKKSEYYLSNINPEQIKQLRSAVFDFIVY